MSFKKIITSSGDGFMVVVGSDNSLKYPVGFSYVLGNVAYTVAQVVTKDAHSDMRRLVASDGSEEIVSVETIEKDLKAYDCHVVSKDTVVAQSPSTEPTEQPLADSKAEVVEIKRKRGRPKKQK